MTSRTVHVMNNRWAPPMKRGSEITLLMIEITISSRDPFLFFLKININAAKFNAAKTAASATAIL